MKLNFYKYQGTGNDFILVDNRLEIFPKNNSELIAKLCDRKFGIGADGFILLENSEISDFKMVYYNADGNTSTMCGNGGRCIVAFAKYLTIIISKTKFEAIDGIHEAKISDRNIHLKMIDVDKVEQHPNHMFLDTGSPHHITYVKDVNDVNVKITGRKIRYGDPYFKEGSNVNFVEQVNDRTFKVRTYERGVEDETLSCGTGVTAVAIASHKNRKTISKEVVLKTQGGDLQVSFDLVKDVYKNVYLKGPAILVFEGVIDV